MAQNAADLKPTARSASSTVSAVLAVKITNGKLAVISGYFPSYLPASAR